MISTKSAEHLISLLLNAVDVVFAFFLIVGGLNATNHSPSIGYGCVAVGFGLLYLTTGMWIGGRWKLITRLVIYVAAAGVILVALVDVVFVRHEPLAAQYPVPIVLVLLVANDLLSIAHLRQTKLKSPLHT